MLSINKERTLLILKYCMMFNVSEIKMNIKKTVCTLFLYMEFFDPYENGYIS